jgi:hypothetical protein
VNEVTSSSGRGFWFPGRWVGGGSLLLGPLLLLSGVVLRLPFWFSFSPADLARLGAAGTFFPLELAAFERRPTLIAVSYCAFFAGNVLLWPAVVALARLIAERGPGWALWGGTLTLFGLFARTFHAGVDHFAFQLVRAQGVDLATKTVGDTYRGVSYGPYDLVGILGFAVLLGWVILAVGAYRSGVLGLIRAVALGLMALLLQGVLKGSTPMSVVETAGLCLALVPLGVQILRGRAGPGRVDDAYLSVLHR